MYKVYFAEDEERVRRAIVDTVDWESVDFKVCGESGDGETALREVLERKPDVLITDIKMPMMDGLELSRLVKKELPNTVILILSGYDEFSFTHQAIRIGVSDYILKPIVPAKLLQALGRAAEEIEQQKDEQRKRRIMQDNLFSRIDDLDPANLTDIRPVINRYAVTDFVKTAERTEINSFAAQQAALIWESAHYNRLYFLCCLYDIFTTLSDAAASIGITAGPMKSFLRPEDDIPSRQALENILKTTLERIIAARDELADSKSQLVSRARLYMENHHNDPDLSLSAVAHAVNVAPNYLSALINRESGQSFSEYLNQLRIKHAMELLRSSSESLSEIARQVGYNDPYYFSKMFKKTLGVSPREFKKM